MPDSSPVPSDGDPFSWYLETEKRLGQAALDMVGEPAARQLPRCIRPTHFSPLCQKS